MIRATGKRRRARRFSRGSLFRGLIRYRHLDILSARYRLRHDASALITYDTYRHGIRADA